jgi:S1-C subfamily serine protease
MTALALLMPVVAAASATAATEAQCASVLHAATEAMRAEDWPRAVRIARSFLSECEDLATADVWVRVVAGMSIALMSDGQNAESLAVANRCLSRVPQAMTCANYKGLALYRLGRFAEARAAHRSVLEMGALTKADMQEQQDAQESIAAIDRRLAAAPAVPALPPPSKPTPQRRAGPRSAGSGFFVTTEGDVLTNAHVVTSCRAVTMRERPNTFDQFDEGPSVPQRGLSDEDLRKRYGDTLTLLRSDKKLDLAVLHAAHGAPAAAKFRSGPLRPGESVVAFGFPLPGLLSSEGNVSVGILSALSGIGDNPRELQISAAVQPGNSGGPLLDANGSVIGVVVAKLDAVKVARITGDIPQGVNFAVKASDAVAFLMQSHSIKPWDLPWGSDAVDPPNASIDVAQVAAIARGFTVQVLCW